MKTTAHYNNETLRQAYDWAVEQKDKLGRRIAGEPLDLGLRLDSDNMQNGGFSCLMSVFFDGKNAILRRDWLRTTEVQYDELINYVDFRKSAPKSADYLEGNAIRLFRHNEYV